MKKNIKIIIGIVLLILIVATILMAVTKKEKITSFEECVNAGYPILESYPEQCKVPGGQTFTNENQLPLTDSSDIDELPIMDQENKDVYSCQLTQDCVPMPGCHPTECINKDFISDFDQPEVCTLEYRYNAAYSPEDCSCKNNVCVNLNLNRTMDEFEEIDQNLTQDTEFCPMVCTVLWELEDNQCNLNECGSGCGADYVITFNTEEECLATLEYNLN